jgi:hypothetical protein
MPKSPSHEFWSQSGLAIEDGKFEDSIMVDIVAFGGSDVDAKGHAVMKLLSFVKLTRKLIQFSLNTPNGNFGLDNIKQGQFFVIGSSPPHVTVNEQNYNVFKMAASLFRTYRCVKSLFSRVECWGAITGFLRDSLEKYPSLKSLILYYLVFILPQFPVILCFALLLSTDYRHMLTSDKIIIRKHQASSSPFYGKKRHQFCPT